MKLEFFQWLKMTLMERSIMMVHACHRHLLTFFISTEHVSVRVSFTFSLPLAQTILDSLTNFWGSIRKIARENYRKTMAPTGNRKGWDLMDQQNRWFQQQKKWFQQQKRWFQ